MNIVNRSIGRYARFVSNRPYLMLVVVILVTAVMVVGSTRVGTKYIENRDIIPQNLEVIKAFNLLEDKFGSDTTMVVAIEIDPSYSGSDEIRDVRDPRVIAYMNLLGQFLETNERVQTASSAATILKSMNNGVLPQSEREIIKLSEENPLIGQYISQDYTMALIRLNLVDAENTENDILILNDVQDIIDLAIASKRSAEKTRPFRGLLRTIKK